MFRSLYRLLAGVFTCILCVIGPLVAQGKRDAYVFGMTTALTGPATDLGSHMRDGVLAAFEEANGAGGIHGRPVELIALDDGYEPAKTAPNMRTLIEEEAVLGVVGNVGTPTAVAALPIALETRTPFLAAFTGAGLLRETPPARYVVNYRASYFQETAAMVDALVRHAGVEVDEIAFFTQRDSYGDAGFAGGIAALMRHGLKAAVAVPHGRYQRNTLIVEAGLAEILAATPEPRAVIMVGAYAPCAAFIKQAKALDFDPLFLNVSFTGAASLAKELGAFGDGVVITQVVPHPDGDAPIAKSHRRAIAALEGDRSPSFVSLEGYIGGRVIVRAMRNAEPPITREKLIDALLALGKFDLGIGAPLELSPNRHQACDRVWPTVIRDGRVVELAWRELSRMLGGKVD